MTLTEFILARIAGRQSDVERRGTYAVGHTNRCIFEGGYEGTGSCDCGAAARVVAESAALRAVVERYELVCTENKTARDVIGAVVAGDLSAAPVPPRTTVYDERVGLQIALRAFAAIWSDHPDYRPEEWA